MSQGRGRTEAQHPAWAIPADRSQQERQSGHPIAPTEFPKVRSAADAETRPPGGGGPHCDILTSRGGSQPPVTSGDGYGLRVTPKLLRDNASHRPTIHRFRQSPRSASPWVFRLPPQQPRRRAVRPTEVPTDRDAVRHATRTRAKARASRKKRACKVTRPAVGDHSARGPDASWLLARTSIQGGFSFGGGWPPPGCRKRP